MNVWIVDEYCCRGECCGAGSWCCAHAGPHSHDDIGFDVEFFQATRSLVTTKFPSES